MQKMKKENLVYVRCYTYNQASYIEEAMDGFCMQETTFPYDCVIVDDASTDGEQEIIKNYLQTNFELTDDTIARHEETTDYYLTYAQHRSNKNCFFAVLFLKYNHYQIKKPKLPYFKEWHDNTKYVALCEGDDYWIDPLKLQKQVDFMEAHPEHSLCFCANQRLLPSGEIVINKRYDSDVEICPMKDIILGGGGYMATNSMLYRQSMYVPYTTWTPNCPVGDLPLMLSLAQKGLVGYLADVMCVYRIAAESSWTTRMKSSVKIRSKHHKAILKMWDQFDKYSNYQYHDAVVKKKRINKKNYRKDRIVSFLISVKKALFDSKDGKSKE